MLKKTMVLEGLVLGILSSLIATGLVWGLVQFYGFTTTSISKTLAIISVVLLSIVFLLILKVKQLSVPGMVGWKDDRSSNEYLFNLLTQAEHSFEYLGATGSSAFIQSGRIITLLKEKYEASPAFVTRVLLMDPDANELIEYRKEKLSNELNALSPEDIKATIQLLSNAKDACINNTDQKLDVRVYSNELVWHIILVDRKLAVLGFYGPRRSGWRWPVMYFKRSDSSFFAAIEEQFDQRWKNSVDV